MKILHDIHTHNVFSTCCTDRTASTLAFMNKEAELGNRVFGLSNHIWDERVKGSSSWYKTQGIARAEEAKNAFSQAPSGLRVMFGCESEYFGAHDLLGMSVEGAEHFDYLIFPHSHMHMKTNVTPDIPIIAEKRAEIYAKLCEAFPNMPEAQIKKMFSALKEDDIRKTFPDIEYEDREIIAKAMVSNFLGLLNNTEFLKIIRIKPVVIAHSFSPCCNSLEKNNEYLCHITDAEFEKCYGLAASLGVNIELGVNSIRKCDETLQNNQMIRAYSIAKRMGCKFTFGTDSHRVVDLGRIEFADTIAKSLGLVKNDIAEFVRDGVED